MQIKKKYSKKYFRIRPSVSNVQSNSTTSVLSLEPKSGKGSKDDLLDPIGSLALLKRSAIYLPNVKTALKQKVRLFRQWQTGMKYFFWGLS